MLKKIIIALIVIALLFGISSYFLYSKKQSATISNAINAVPSDAAIVVVIHNLQSFYKKVSNGNIIWDELNTTVYFRKLNKRLNFIDSLSKSSPLFVKILNKNDIIASAHLSGAGKYNFLFSLALPIKYNEENVLKYLKNKLNIKPESSNYDGVHFYKITLKNNEPLFFCINNGILISSFSSILIESSIRQQAAKHSITQDKNFKIVKHTAGQQADANIFIHYSKLAQIISTKLKNDLTKKADMLAHYADWTELDLNLKTNEIALNGFTYCPDSTQHFLTIFKDQQAEEMDISTVLPENTAFFTNFGISDIDAYLSQYKNYLKKQHDFYKLKKFLEQFEMKYNFDLEKQFKGWVGNEMAFVAMESANNKIDNDLMLVIHTRNPEKSLAFFDKLNSLGDSSTKSTATNYRNYKIYHLQAFPDFFGHFLGKTFAAVHQPYYTIIGKYLFFANSVSTLRNCINYYEAGKTLYLNPNFTAFRDHLTSDANILIYSNIARSVNFYSYFLNDDLQKLINENDTLVRKFEAFAIQVSHDSKDLYYNNIYLKYNPVYKKETNSLWETKLSAPIIYGPQLVTNFYTGGLETVVQDSALNLYLISNTGKILWKKQLSEKLQSNIYQIDAYKNNKLQMVFNTADKLWILDRNSNTIPGFPVTLPAPAASDVAVLDYDNDRDYRIFISCANNMVYNYDKTGKIIKGWDMKKTSTPVSHPTFHFKIKAKDYIVNIEKNGSVKVVDRRGDERLKIENTLALSNFPVYYQIGSSLSKSRMLSADSLGNVYSLYFDGQKTSNSFKSCDSTYGFAFKKIDSTGNYAYLIDAKGGLYVFNSDKKILFQFQNNSGKLSSPQVFKLKDNTYKIGVCDTKNHQIYLLDTDGNVCSGFPLFGGKNFTIGDINLDGASDLVTSQGNVIYTYSLSNN